MKLILSLFLLFAVSGDRDSADALFAAGYYEEARTIYVSLLDEAEEPAVTADLLERVGTTLLYEGRYWDAEAHYADSLATMETATARMRRGEVYFYAGQTAAMDGTALGAEVMSLMNDAVRELARAVELEPGLAEAHEFLGFAERYRRNPRAEEASYRRALACEPGRPGASLFLAYLLDSRGAQAEALRLLLTVPDAQRSTEHYLLMGRLAGATEDQEEERKAYVLAVLSSPEDTRVYQVLWDATGFKKHFDVFNAAMEEVLAERPDAYLAHYFLGFSHQYAKRPEEAVAAFRRALVINPEYFRARLMIAEVLRQDLRDEAAARTEYLELLRVDPGNSRAREVLAGMAFAAARDRDLDNAVIIFTALKEAEPTQWVHRANLALIMKERNRPDEAVKIYEEAEELFPYEAQIPNDRGLLLMGLGRTEEAFAAFRTALDRDSEFLDALENLGAYSLLGGDAEAAIGYFRRAHDRVRADGGDATKFRRYLDLAAHERGSR